MITPMRADVSGCTAWKILSNHPKNQEGNMCYHEAEISPLVKEIAVYIDTVRLAEVFPDECAD